MENVVNFSLGYINDTSRTSAYFKKFAEHRNLSIYFPIEQVISWYSMLLIVVGTICNLTSFSIMLRKNIRKHSCMRYLSILTLSDTLVLYQWNFATFYKYNLSFAPSYLDLEDISLIWCRWISYFAFSSLQISSWLLCAVSIDRVMIIYAPRLQTFISKKTYRINMVIGSVVLGIMMINMHILFLNGFTITEDISTSVNHGPINTTGHFYQVKRVVCYQSKSDSKYMFPKWQRVHLFIYNIIPFSVMLICNSLIIYSVKFAPKVKSKTKSSSKRKNRMTFLLLLITFSFMVLTLPSVIVHSFFKEILSKKAYRRLINIVVGNLLHTSHTINFFFYIFSAPNFQLEFSMTFDCIIKRLRKPTGLTQKKIITTTKTTTKKNKKKAPAIAGESSKPKIIAKVEKPQTKSLLPNTSENSSCYENS